jgi:hypothetical protein
VATVDEDLSLYFALGGFSLVGGMWRFLFVRGCLSPPRCLISLPEWMWDRFATMFCPAFCVLSGTTYY